VHRSRIQLGGAVLWGGLLHLAPRLASALSLVFIGRTAGPGPAGVFVLGVTYLLIASSAMRGLDDLTIRESSRQPAAVGAGLRSYLPTRVLLSAIAYLLIAVMASIIFQYDSTTRAVVLIVGLAVIPDSIASSAQSVLLGAGRHASPTLAALFASALKLAAVGWVLATSGSLSQIAWAWVTASIVGSVISVWIAISIPTSSSNTARSQTHRHALKLDVDQLAFLSISVLLTLDGQIDTLVLAATRPQSDVGYFGAATTVAYSFLVLSQGVRIAIYPEMSRLAPGGDVKLHELYLRAVSFLGVIGMAVFVALSRLSSPLVLLLFGPSFAGSVAPLLILGLAVGLMFPNEANSRLLLAQGHHRMMVGTVSAVAATTVALNLLLAPRMGPVGSAWARTLSSALFLLLNLIRLRGHAVFVPAILRLARAAVAAGIALLAASSLQSQSDVLSAGVALATYLGVFVALGLVHRTQRGPERG